MDLAQRLSELVSASGSTAWEVSDLSGLAPSHISLILRRSAEDPAAGLSGKTAVALAHTLGCSVAWLLTGEGARPTDATVRAAVERARAASARKSA